MLILNIPDIKYFNDIRLPGESWFEAYMSALKGEKAPELVIPPELLKPIKVELVVPKLDVNCTLTSSRISGIKVTHDNRKLFSLEAVQRFQERTGVKYPTKELVNVFEIFGECIVFQTDGRNPNEKEQQMILDMIFQQIGLLPKEVLPDKIKKAGVTDLSKDKFVGDADSIRKETRIDLRYHLGSTIPHELTHLIFLHSDDESFWIGKYTRLVGSYDKADASNFLDNHLDDHNTIPYGKTDIYEDMATIGESMFSKKGWNYIESRSNPIIKKKVEVMLRLFAEVSEGMMDRKFFSMIRSGGISNAVDAQRYFERKRSEKQKSLTTKALKAQKEEYAKKEAERLAKIADIESEHARHPQVRRLPLLDEGARKWRETFWVK